MREGYVAGHPRERIEADATAALRAAGFQVDYAVLRTRSWPSRPSTAVAAWR